MNQAGRQFLAAAVLSRDEHRRAQSGPAILPGRAVLRMVGLAATKNMSSPICSISSVSDFALAALAVKKERTPNRGLQLLRPQRPNQIILGPQADCFQFLTGIVGG